MKKQPEFELQKKVCRYLTLQYPTVLFLSDTIASVKLTKPQAGRNACIQKKGFKTPDLIVFEPNRGYNGLFVELKVKSPYKLNGELYKSDHLEAQAKTIAQLTEKGYFAVFKWEFEEIKKVIDWYLS